MARPNLLTNDPRFIVVEWPAEIDASELSAHFAEMTGLLEASKRRLVCVVDVTSAKGMNALLRKEAAQGLRGLAARAASRVAGVAYVTGSVAVRGALTAIHWLAPVPFPTTVVATRAEAMRWAEALAARSAR